MSARPDATTWHRSTNVVGRRLPDGWLLLGPTMVEPVHLSPTASVIWDHLDDALSADQLVAALHDLYPADPAEIAHDAARTIDQLEALALVERGVAPR